MSMFSLKALLAALVLAIGVPIAFSQTNPVRLATAARIDLTSSNVNLTNGQVIAGTGQIKRADWLSSSSQPRSYSAEFTINHLGWHEVGLRFRRPRHDLRLELRLFRYDASNRLPLSRPVKRPG